MTISKYRFDPIVRSANSILVLKQHRKVGASERVEAIKASAALIGKNVYVEENTLDFVFVAESQIDLSNFDAIIVMLQSGAPPPAAVYELSELTNTPVGLYDYVSCPAFTDTYEDYLRDKQEGGAFAKLVDVVGVDVVFAGGMEGPHSLDGPSAFYERDPLTKSWLPNLDAARESKLQQVAAELSTRLYLPYNGFDADKVSRERISGMIARIQRGDGLPTGWMGWRDASNQQHWSQDDAATVLANLTALSRAIEDREQVLLIAAWQHKAAIAALTSVEALLAYDVTAGW
jgi:hypothetical protein